MNLNGGTAVKDIAVSSPAAARILEKAGVDYCCGGSRSLQDACAEAGVSAEEMLARLRASGEPARPEDADWLSAPLGELTKHIRERHHGYVRGAIPRVRALLEKVKAKHGATRPEIALIEGLFLQLGQEMIAHMQKEEIVLFPYIERLELARREGAKLERPFFQTVRNPIQMMINEHDAAGDLAKQIRKASSGYATPADACASYQRLYSELLEFETDLHQHVHLENNILFPRAIEMENEGY
jgi:regulator of cell morphogenesis and NO signaling